MISAQSEVINKSDHTIQPFPNVDLKSLNNIMRTNLISYKDSMIVL
jgi:hypothetical protein